MTDNALLATLVAKYAGRNWVLHGNTYDGLEWSDTEIPKPSKADLGLE